MHYRLNLLALLGLVFCLFSSWSRANPWINLYKSGQQTHGFVGVSFTDAGTLGSDEQSADEDGLSTSWIANIINDNLWQGYIDKPWIATTSIKTQLTANINSFDVSSNENTSVLTASALNSINLYPDSDYPTIFTLKQLVGENSSTRSYRFYRTDFTVNNIYTPKGKSYSTYTNYKVDFDTEDADSSVGGEEHDRFDQQFDFDFSDRLASSNYSVIARAQRKDLSSIYGNGQIDTLDESMSLQYMQNWAFGASDSTYFSAELSSEERLSKNENDSETTSDNYDVMQSNVSSYIRSKDIENLTYNFNAFVNRTEQKFNFQDEEFIHQNGNVLSGATWDYNDNWRFNGSFDANYSDSQNVKTVFYSGALAANYDDDRDLSESVRLNWYVGNSVGIERGDFQGENYALNLGNGITKSLHPFNTLLTISFNQSLIHQVNNAENIDPDEWQINHDLDLNWSEHQGGVDSTAILTISDTRHLTDDPYHFQRASFTVGRDAAITENDSWGGDFIYEWSKTIHENVIESINQDGTVSINEGGIESTTSRAWGNLFYRNSELFGVQNLRFTSELSVPFDDILPEEQTRDSNEVANWRNRLDYRIGQLEFDADSTLTEENYNFSINVRRYFNF